MLPAVLGSKVGRGNLGVFAFSLHLHVCDVQGWTMALQWACLLVQYNNVLNHSQP